MKEKQCPFRNDSHITNNAGQAQSEVRLSYVMLTGDQTNEWMEASIELSSTQQVVFTGSVGNGWQSDMALDDIQIVFGSCDPGVDGKYQIGNMIIWHIHVFNLCCFYN